MKTTTAQKHKYLTPLDIPAAQRGEAEIIREVKTPGTPMMLGNGRTAIFGQGKHKPVAYPFPTTWHQLILDGGRMMSDWPIEQRQITAALRGMKGRVLVGGLGLGLAATLLAQKKAVTHVTVVEASEDVIRLVGPYTKGRWNPKGRDRGRVLEHVHADLFEYLKNYAGPPFDHAFYDIWASDGEGTFFGTVCPLYDLSRGKVKTPPVNWNEDVMRGQLHISLQSRLLWTQPHAIKALKIPPLPRPMWEEDGTDKPWWNWQVPFWAWWKDRQPDEQLVQQAISYYVSQYGKWRWRGYWQAFTEVTK